MIETEGIIFNLMNDYDPNEDIIDSLERVAYDLYANIEKINLKINNLVEIISILKIKKNTESSVIHGQSEPEPRSKSDTIISRSTTTTTAAPSTIPASEQVRATSERSENRRRERTRGKIRISGGHSIRPHRHSRQNNR